jgi:PEP-CTERM motif
MKAKEIRLSFSLVLLVAFSSRFSNAETVTYSFEPPQLVFGQSTPLFNIVPDVGPSSFLASFTAPTGGSCSINNFRANPSFTGQNLLDPAYPGATLRVTLNTPITDVQLDFELAVSSGHLQFQCFSGTTNFNAIPSTQYGSLVFHSPVPFTQFDLSGFNSSNTGTFFAIDNLVMTFVPEPSTFSLFIAGISVLALRSVQRKHAAQAAP